MSKVGCQPYWLDYINTDIVNCTKSSQLEDFLKHMTKIVLISTEKELKDDYDCLKPCTYMEYKVYINNLI